MSKNIVKITRATSFSTGENISNITDKPYKENLSSVLESGSKDAVEKALGVFWEKAVARAWEIKEYSDYGATGLLANSIYYTFDKQGSALKGLNSHKETPHQVDEGMYADDVEFSGIRKSQKSGVVSGFVGTQVAHIYDVHPETVQKEVDTGDSVDEQSVVLAKYYSTVQYAPYVEYGSWNSLPHPFMGLAAEDARAEMKDVVTTEMSQRLKDAVAVMTAKIVAKEEGKK